VRLLGVGRLLIDLQVKGPRQAAAERPVERNQRGVFGPGSGREQKVVYLTS